VGFCLGQRIADYEIVAYLGAGGMGRVYRVRNVISERAEAMKVLLADLQAEPELAARFVSEIRTLATLDHPNIAQLRTALQLENELVMIMEFVDGLTLQQLAQQGALPADQIFRYVQQVLAALGYAHYHGVVHRDVKPANIMVTPEGVAKLTDFGIAKTKAKNQHTQPGLTMGSLHYMSPEQAMGSSAVDARSDLYSVGIMMYELLAGCLPFEDESAYVLLQSQLNEAPRPPIEVNPNLSVALNELILKSLDKDPAARFQSATSFGLAIEQATGVKAILNARYLKTGKTSAAFAVPATPRVATAKATSRFPLTRRRKLWFATEAIAATGLLAATVVGLSHTGITRALAKTDIPSPEPPPSLTLSKPVDIPRNAPVAVADLSPSAPPRTAIVPEVSVPRKRLTLTREAKPITHPVKDAKPHSQENADGMEGHTASAAVAGADMGALKAIREQLAKLEARAATLRAGVKRVKAEREAAGDGLDQEMAAAYVRMNAYLSAEKADLEDADLASARDHIEKAASQMNVLEGLLSGTPTGSQVASKRSLQSAP
jgi:eukaryotic-like serine/threonine-protein kinase